MNKGIKLARGSIIGIINSDDTYNKNAVKNAFFDCKVFTTTLKHIKV